MTKSLFLSAIGKFALCFIAFLAYPFIIMKRIRNEEEVLARELNGYPEYMQKVRWRLIPFIW